MIGWTQKFLGEILAMWVEKRGSSYEVSAVVPPLVHGQEIEECGAILILKSLLTG